MPIGLDIAADEAHADRLRRSMVDQLRQKLPDADRVMRAMLAVPRHRFVPEATFEDAYRVHGTVVTKRDQDGAPVSSASAPWVVAFMLAQADLREGQRVLEVGAGTGYNAALLQELVGPEGRVVTVDIDAESVERAQAALADSGADAVEVVCVDGALGAEAGGLWDRIVVTTGPSDIAPTWAEQLAEGGLLVVPLRWRGIWRGLTLRKTGARLVAESVEMYGFIPMQGLLSGEREVDLAGDGRLVVAVEADHPVCGGEFAEVLEAEPRIDWTGVRVGNAEDDQGLWTRIACAEPLAARYTRRLDDPDPVLAQAVPRAWTLALVNPDGRSIVYLAGRPDHEEAGRFELGVGVYGPDEGGLGAALAAHVRQWDADRLARPEVTIVAAGSPDTDLPPGAVIVDKPLCRMVFKWAQT